MLLLPCRRERYPRQDHECAELDRWLSRKDGIFRIGSAQRPVLGRSTHNLRRLFVLLARAGREKIRMLHQGCLCLETNAVQQDERRFGLDPPFSSLSLVFPLFSSPFPSSLGVWSLAGDLPEL